MSKEQPTASSWSPTSWHGRPARFQPEYADKEAYTRSIGQLRALPPLVFPGEVEHLRSQIAEAASGRQFILHGGDCVERFIDCNDRAIANKLKILLQMSVILSHAARMPVVRIGRIAGQFFKPRTNATETFDGKEYLTYRGDTVNGFAPEEREPKPERLLEGYFHATATLNYIRSMIDGGFADLHHPYSWNLHAIEQTANWNQYQAILESILDAIHFMESFGGVRSESLGRIDFYTSHEGLHLDYESALTRASEDGWYNLSAHVVWVGERTRRIDGAHVEYFRGIRNPIGVKLGPNADPAEVVKLTKILNPLNDPGRLLLITRMGSDVIAGRLPILLREVLGAGRKAAWLCDPMHGNTRTTETGRKTRPFDRILDELRQAFAIHREQGNTLAGVHFELTGDQVTECVGGSQQLAETDLELNYESYCDPRLNYVQSMEMAFLISRFLRPQKE